MTVLPATTHHILNIAHRGARAFAPENTLAAFTKAKSLGCDMFETDVRLTQDGSVVVFHDEDLKRCTDAENRFPGRASYKVADFTNAELGVLDAGSWYVKQLALPSAARQLFLQSLSEDESARHVSPSEQTLYASGQIKIPSLLETLSIAKTLGLLVNLELKSEANDGSRLVAAVLDAVRDVNMADAVLISAFDHELLRQVRAQSPTIAIAVLTDEPIKATVGYLRKLKANAYHLGRHKDYRADAFNSVSGRRYLTHIAKVRQSGFPVNIWTCNDPVEMTHLLTAGTTGLISDFPNRVRDVLADVVCKQKNQ